MKERTRKKRLHRQLRWARIWVKNQPGRIGNDPFFPMPGHTRRLFARLFVTGRIGHAWKAS